MKRITIYLCMLFAMLPAMAQDTGNDKNKKEKVVVEPSVAWGLDEPLGDHREATIDTLFENYHLTAVPSLPSAAWATTGNYGAAGQNQLFFERPATSEFFMEDAIAHWLHTTATHRFYNTRIPMTLLSYATGGNKYSNQDRTRGLFSGNVNRRLQVGAGLDYIYSKGSYDNQADKNFDWHGMLSYMGDRYELQTFYSHYSFTTLENGGITDDRYITDPAAVQGGVTSVDNKSITTRLTAAQNALESSHFYMNHRYKVGFYRTQRDSVTDSIVSRTYVPVTSFIWTLDYKNNNHRFLNQNGLQDTTFFPHTYLGLGGTDERTRAWRLRNTVGVALLEGFNRYAKFGFSVYSTHEVRCFTQVADTVAERDAALDAAPATVPGSTTQNLLWVGGRLTKQQGALLRYSAQAQLGVLGEAAGEVDVTGDVVTRFRLGRDSVSLRAYGYFKNLAVPYLLQNFRSNHAIWSNDFGKIKRLRVGGELTIPHTWTRVNVGYETLKNYVFFDSLALPAQQSSPIHVLSATIHQDLHLKAFHWENAITIQTSSDDAVLPLPKLAVYSNVYLKVLIARVLHMQLGVDANYYTKYHAPTYNPATMAFYNQNQSECGNFLFMNLYANFKLKRARFYVAYTHANGKLFGGNDYFAIPHYPLNPRRFQVGVSVDFAN
ncbi:MAG: putative porin [Muribaculaceae bacterium]|nr:putative porin [Muribaculaceae bacterium]